MWISKCLTLMQNMMSFYKKMILIAAFVPFVFGCAVPEKDQQVQEICDSFSRKYAPDKRTAIFDIQLENVDGKLVIKGTTDQLLAKTALVDSLVAAQISFADSIKVLPDEALGDKTWALGTLSSAGLRAQSGHASELVSQVLLGTPLKVLETQSGWYRVQTPDFYIGWIEGNGLTLFNQSEMDQWKASTRIIFNRISGNVFESPNSGSAIVSDVVLGDLFEQLGEEKGFLKIRFPDGRTGFIDKSQCLAYEKWVQDKPDVEAIFSVAKQLMGVPYLWGGTSCKALDCSGFTKNAYFSQGIILARDASQQARYGQHIDFNSPNLLEPGDLLFFGRNIDHIIHVGLYLGNGKYIHASGLVRINSINPADPDYNITEQKKLVAASRIVNSLNTEGITLVKDHPWYLASK